MPVVLATGAAETRECLNPGAGEQPGNVVRLCLKQINKQQQNPSTVTVLQAHLRGASFTRAFSPPFSCLSLCHAGGEFHMSAGLSLPVEPVLPPILTCVGRAWSHPIEFPPPALGQGLLLSFVLHVTRLSEAK